MFRDLSGQIRWTGQLLSELVVLPVHYFGRTIPCAGKDCEACGYRSPRRHGYFAACGTEGVAKFYEVCESFVHAIEDAMRPMSPRPIVDGRQALVLTVQRSSTRNAWSVDRADRASMRGQGVATVELLGNVARLYRLPVPLPSETARDWFERVRVSQNDLLRAALLPFGRSLRVHEHQCS